MILYACEVHPVVKPTLCGWTFTIYGAYGAGWERFLAECTILWEYGDIEMEDLSESQIVNQVCPV